MPGDLPSFLGEVDYPTMRYEQFGRAAVRKERHVAKKKKGKKMKGKKKGGMPY